MEISYDAAKDLINQEKHGCSLALAANLDWETALVVVDDRKAYGEVRYRALGLVGNRVYFAAYTVRGEGCRMISFRKANLREVKAYVEA